jgi:MoaA/NifB/PqqE/SkfB family radical SAM enzyme
LSTPIPTELLERIWFYTNFDCTLRCSYCVAALTPGEERGALSLAQFRRLLDQALGLGFRQVAVTGGEPFMHPDIPAILQYATTRSNTVVLTNGLWVTSNRPAALEGTDKSRLTLQVSLDSADPETHDRLRGRGTWRRATRGLQMLLEAGYTVAVRATLDGQNEGVLEGLTQYLAGLGVPQERVYGAAIAHVGRATHGLDLDREGLNPEPTVISDGLYWHPLLIEPPTAVTGQIEPLDEALGILAALAEQTKPGKPQGVR